MDPADLFRHIARELPHELGHLLDRVERGKQVDMVGHHGNGVHGGSRILLGTGEATHDERIEARGGLEQVASLDRPLGDFYRGPWVG